MDFVDLDKVLDDFEEEEKAATSRVPGQELKPSGYAQYIESHQERPWEGLVKVPPTTAASHPYPGGPPPPHSHYDTPFQSGKSLAEELQDQLKGEGLLGNAFPSQPGSNSLPAHLGYPDSSNPGFPLKPGLNGPGSQNGLDLPPHGRPGGQGSSLSWSFDGLSQGSLSSNYSSGEKRGLMASQVTAVQTDALTPRTEKELLSLPFPRSDIIVEGKPSEAAPAPDLAAEVGTMQQPPKMMDCPAGGEQLDREQSWQTSSQPVVNGSDQNDLDRKPNDPGMYSSAVANHIDSQGTAMNLHASQPAHAQSEVMGFGSVNPEVNEQDLEAYLADGDSTQASSELATGHAVQVQQQNPDLVTDVGHSQVFQAYRGVENNVQLPRTEVPMGSHDISTKTSDQLHEQPGVNCERGLGVAGVTDKVDSHSSLEAEIPATTGLSNSHGTEALGSQVMGPKEAMEAHPAADSFVSGSMQDSHMGSVAHNNTVLSHSTPSSSNPKEFGSPQLGIGARPKDPSAIKKNRPNSLLGLSKVSMEPIPPAPPAVDMPSEATESSKLNAVPGDATMGGGFAQQARMEQAPGQMEQAHLLRMEKEGSVPAGAPVVSDAAATGTWEEGEEAPQMRQKPEVPGMEGGTPEAGDQGRPHSWSPPSSVQAHAKNKRPNSLNLPVRQPDDSSDPAAIRTRTVALLPQSQIAEESEGAAAEEYSVGEELGAVGEEQAMAAAQESPTNDGSLAPAPILHTQLGRVAPHWVPDAEAPNCMACQARFTFTKRRHHCRACGKVFCSTCCSLKGRLGYMENKEARVCQSCHQLLLSADPSSQAGPSLRSPNPNNPSEYCSTIPPPQQANARALPPTVMVPVGVLKREGSTRRSEPKQVMFSDGIRPGGDLTELDGSNESRLPPRRTGRVQKKVEKSQNGQSSPKMRRLRGAESRRYQCLIPEQGLPPIFIPADGAEEPRLEENPDPAKFMPQIKDEEAEPVIFAINSNLYVMVKINNLDCCVNRLCWCFTTKGLCTVGQDELVLVVEMLPEESTVPRDIFCHISTVYQEASKGNTVADMGHSIFNQSFLDSRDHGGFLYIRPTFQCLQKLLLPGPPYLFAILLQKWETPWAKVFPIRLLLRLGAEYRYYPCPLVSIRNHKPVFYEIGHTIMNLLADFRNYQYMLPQIRGVTIHMEDKRTTINFPRNRYQELMKVVNNSNEHVMALGANFSPDADSHLVCIQNDEGNYQTQAINIQNKPRKVTGASFVVFNGALKTSTGLRAKSSIVEDGLMVQITPEAMAALKQSLKDMKDYAIGCGPMSAPQPEETVTVQWVEDDKNINIGVKSPVDNMAMDGVESVRIHTSTDYVGENKVIRWTEVFFIRHEDSGSPRWEPMDLNKLAGSISEACCIALTPHLDALAVAGQTRLGLRVTLDSEQVGYEIGSNGERLGDMFMNDLDSALIPVIHNAASQSQDGPIVVELIFYVLD